MPKLLLAGGWQYDFYEKACADALAQNGVEVVPFSWNRFFSSLPGRAEAKYVIAGPLTLAMNHRLLSTVRRERPDFVFVWRGTHVLPRTLRAIRSQTGAALVSYNNDDPFSPRYSNSELRHWRRLWKIFKASIPEYDLHFVYRQCNLAEFCEAGARRALLLRSYYIPSVHRPVSLSEEERARFAADVVFVGHYEPERWQYIRALVENGLKVRIFGRPSSWNASRLGDLAEYFGRIEPVFGDDYAKALCGAKMALCFFSRLNRDTYTRRAFEIPACGSVLLSERTEEMQSLFAEEAEAVYFSTREELVDKALALIRDEARRQRIAQAGHGRCLRDGHSIDARMQWALAQMQAIGVGETPGNPHLPDRELAYTTR